MSPGGGERTAKETLLSSTPKAAARSKKPSMSPSPEGATTASGGGGEAAAATAVALPLRGHRRCFALPLPPWLTHCLCVALPLPAWLWRCRCVALPLSAWLRHRLSLRRLPTRRRRASAAEEWHGKECTRKALLLAASRARKRERLPLSLAVPAGSQRRNGSGLTDALHRQLGEELLAQPAEALPARQHSAPPRCRGDECATDERVDTGMISV